MTQVVQEDSLLSKIAKLLKLAENASNEHEADAFMTKAQELATRTQIDLEVARAHSAKNERRKVPTQKTVTLFGKQERKLAKKTFTDLFVGIALANDVKIDISGYGHEVYLFGFDTDIELVEALYASLSAQMLITSDHHLKNGFREETEVYNRRSGELEIRRESGRTVRVSFQAAFARRVSWRLSEARKATIASVQEESTGTELVLRNKALEVADFYTQHSEAGNRAYKTATVQSVTAARAGDKAGSRARLGGEKAIGGHRTQVSA